MQTSGVRTSQKWRWAGDEIVDSTIPASRKVPGSEKTRYPIDIREFLSIEHNTVVRKFLDEEVIDPLPSAGRERFLRNGPGNFDFRLQEICRAFGKFRYRRSDRGFDHWLFPVETLVQKGGDCEDLAFLLAAMIEEAGVSTDCIRVALGTLIDHVHPRTKPHDHAWVVYQTEHGVWHVLDPVSWVGGPGRVTDGIRGHQRRPESRPLTDIEYVPFYVFNRHHLWRIRSPQSLERTESLPRYLGKRSFWQHFDPAFAKSAHESIFSKAMQGISEDDLQIVNWTSLRVDVNVFAYDPRDHFDFAYIDAGWQRIRHRLNTGDLRDFALAAHGIADFYAHTLYGQVTAPANGRLPVYDPAHPPVVAKQLDFLFEDPKFLLPGAQHSREWARDHWSGRLISGQWWRWFTTYPDKLEKPSELVPRRCLPDHDQLAVDKPTGGGGDHLYDAETYNKQFQWRSAAAIAHVSREWNRWRRRSAPRTRR
jgi:hypothetical protein